MDLAEGIALRGGVNVERLGILLLPETKNIEPLSVYAFNTHSRFLPELSLGGWVGNN